MEDLSIYHDKDNGVYLSAYVGLTDILSIGIEDPESFISQEFNRGQVIELRDWLSELIEKTTPPPAPTNAEIIEALTPGSVFTLSNTYNADKVTWFRTDQGAIKPDAYAVHNFLGWNGDQVKVEVNYIHKSEENN